MPLSGERGALIASIAQAKGRIAETKLQILQVEEGLQQEVANEVRAPQSGIVHELALDIADAVIAPGEIVMLIVPAADELEAEIKIAPQDIDQLSIGQEVNLRFSAFNQQTTPEVAGTLERIGADLTHEAQTGLSYYTVRVAVGPDEVKKLGAVKLLPGMPVEAFVKTEDRTALSYLMKPLEDQIRRAFREE